MFTEHQTLLFEGTDFYFRHSVDSLHSSVVKVLRVLFAHLFQRTKVIVLNPGARVKANRGDSEGILQQR